MMLDQTRDDTSGSTKKQLNSNQTRQLPDSQHLKIKSLSIYIVIYLSRDYKDQFTFLSVRESSTFEKGTPYRKSKNVKNYTENAESRIIYGPLSDQPDREHGNVGKKNLAYAIVA